ncbi:sulfate/molybdate ABC transporter ATP-binding protein [Tindallia californiensis]|uniref:Iron(III) transport system ATP-binding protein/molybdate transport system ATP-binding protein n=1 Tax=Tindallia californiensis TaxID=159292 RepID=A0A1H3Q4Z6_9FIRM|nr:ATP-binding cassette domain-containing protein [Tindallia californiensis]SDZ08456.1 iron(III) transport system ATP-binding protein/molybdate transport system ATP-binding protein [Tindallia californiensis]
MIALNIKKQMDTLTIQGNWQCAKGEVATLFGPSGSGKSVTLKMIAGLIMPDAGWIEIGNRTVYHHQKKTCMAAKDRGVGYVPQNYGLFPHMKVQNNILFGINEGNKQEKEEKALELLRSVGLEQKRHRYPSQLSGGEKQRVAILRALASSPEVLLLDEPFAAIDLAARKKLRTEIRDYLEKQQVATVLVTHDPEDIKMMRGQVIPYGNS